jgi:hypothetical protein
MATPEEKRWAKEARSRRQALKKAAMPAPNLFQARIRRTELNNRPRSYAWLWILFLMIGGAAGAAWWTQRVPSPPPHDKLPAATLNVPAPDLNTKLQASSAPVVTPVTVSIAPVVDASMASSTPTAHAVIPDTREWHSQTSEIHEVRQVVIKSRKGLRALWQDMGRTDEAPRINFYDHWVVGLFLGPKDGAGYEVQMSPLQESDDQATVSYRVIEPLPGTPLSTDKTYPWQLRVVLRTEKPLHFVAVSPASAGASH